MWQESCPPKVDHSKGYTWVVHPEYDIFVQDLASGALAQVTSTWGYDAEATISPLGDRMVFTSLRSGDLELWTSKLDGSDPRQVTHRLGYDGGAFFSHDGKQLVFRSTAFAAGKEAQEEARYRELLAESKVRPQSMEIMLCDADGSNIRQLTHLGGANFAPYFFPDDRRILFTSNYHETNQRNFDLFAVGLDGEKVERITTYDGFDCFPMFSPDGKWLVFASNRGGKVQGETNLFIARWK
jgi:Tol biopolymer transport system component